MRKAREDIIGGRSHEVKLVVEGLPTIDPDTDEKIPGEIWYKEVDAIITEVNRGLGSMITLENGVIVENYEIKFDIALVDWVDTDRIIYEDKAYRRIADSRKGIGTRNRVEVYAEVIR